MVIEKLAERRNRLLLINAAAFVIWQASSFGPHLAGRPAAPILIVVSLAAFVGWAWTLTTLLRPLGDARTQAALNDELTHQHRQQALLAGYWAMLICAAGAIVVTSVAPISPVLTLRALVVVGVAAPLVRFVILERRVGGE